MIDDIYIIIPIFTFLFIARIYHLFFNPYHHSKGVVFRPWLQFYQLGLFGLLMVLSLLELEFLARQPVWLLTFFVLSVTAATQILKVKAKHELGALWSAHVEIQRDSQLITTGPYASIRHPSYLNGILESLFVPLIAGSWLTFWVALVLVPIIFSLRILTEEKALENRFGPEYIQYCKNTPRFFNYAEFISAIQNSRITYVLFSKENQTI